MKKLTDREIQLEEIKILKQVVKYFERNGLSYSLAGGTLLGAIRHNGFIPWDDDIDLFMTRPNYDKLIELLKHDNFKISNYNAISIDFNNSYQPFIKIINQNIKTIDPNIKDRYQCYLWIDIFPIDAFPKNEKEINKIFKKRDLWKKIYSAKIMKFQYLIKKDEIIFIKLIKIISKFIISFLSCRFIMNHIYNISKKYNYNSNKIVGNIVWGYGSREGMEKSVFEKTFYHIFEDDKYLIPKEYDKYLKKIYGNYMQLPPIEKRITHNFDAWSLEYEKN